MNQQQITDEGVFTHKTKGAVNSNFTELYNAATTFRRGPIYYVDLIDGSANNDGLTWATAFAQVTTAVTASETWRLAQTNVYLRPLILVAGAANTCYDGLTTLPNYTDVVGIGASYLGDMSGVAVLGTDTTKNGTNTAEMRGSTFFNIQFRGGGSNNSALLALKILRCRFEECFFRVGASGVAGVNVYTAGTGAGNIFTRCNIGYGNGGTYGIYIQATNNWDTCRIEDCTIRGATTAYRTAAYLQNQTIVKNCTLLSGTGGYAIHDTSAETDMAGSASYVGNFCQGGSGTTDPASVILITNNPLLRSIGNTVVTGNGASYRYAGTTAL